MAVRYGGSPGRLVSLLLALFVLSTLLGVAGIAVAQEQEIDDEKLIIDLGGTVYRETCDPCHGNIAQTDNYSSEIIFQHGYHQLISCSSCHSRFPHRKEGTERPTMKGCFACHGLSHGPMGDLATGECEDCHNTPKDRLRPSWHGWDWAKKPHVQPSLDELQTTCMMCHDQAWCDDCHVDEFVRWEPEVPYVFDSDGGCLSCHGSETLVKTSAGQPKSYQVLGVEDSAHGEVSCQQCHVDYNYEQMPGVTPLWNVNAGKACENCHADAAMWGEDTERAAANAELVADYSASVHGAAIADGNFESATCAGCHGGHYIERLNTDFAKAKLQASAYRVCARCHLDEYDSYDDYYHGAAYKKGAPDAPACWECHGAHGVLPDSDPASMVSSANLAGTCGQEGCHLGSGEDFTVSATDLIHTKKETAEGNPLAQFWSNIRSWFS